MKLSYSIALLASSALASIAAGQAAQAQQTAAAAAPVQTIGEIIVTATRRSDTIHNIPLSVTALTTQDVERQGLKNAQDLVTAVTSLRVSPVNGGGTAGATGNPDVAIRGIRGTSGSATTGIYVDDVPLQQRTATGPTGGGTVFPNLFDLERVEVLKGPQGTLYGGSSEGGTIRFITPQPSFVKQSLYLRAEGSSTDQGAPNYEFGAEAGGPIVADKLAVRLSGLYRQDGGYIDHVSQYTGKVLPGGKDTNSATHDAFHGALAWKPVADATITLSYLYVKNNFRDSDQYWESIPAFQQELGPAPGHVVNYPAFNFGPYKSGQNTNVGLNYYTSDAQLSPLLSPHTNEMSLPALTVDYAVGDVNLKSVTAFAETKNTATPNFSYVDTASRSVTPLEGGFNKSGTVVNGVLIPYANCSTCVNSGYIASLPNYSSVFAQQSQIDTLSEEARLSSNNPDSRLSWVAGVFYDFSKLSSNGVITSNTGDLAAAAIFGAPSATGTPFASLNGVGLVEPQYLDETQIAGFGEGTYKVTDKLKVTVGLRVTQDKFNFQLYQGGALFGFAPGVLATLANGSITETPVTPKFGLQYVFDSNANVYFTAAKGFRPGGVNQSLPPACAASLAAVGYTAAPVTYASDSLWSYEGGAKVKAFGGKANMNASVFKIDWSNVQTTVPLSCGQNFIVAKAQAVSQGADFQGTFLLFDGFVASVNVAYTDAHYTQSVDSIPGTRIIAAGDNIPFTPKWNLDLGGEYRFHVMQKSAYVRADYTYASSFQISGGPNLASTVPDNYKLPGYTLVNARAGITFDSFELSAFVNNLTESRDLQARNGMASGPGRVNCTAVPACTSYGEIAVGAIDTTFRPRTIGLALSYRY